MQADNLSLNNKIIKSLKALPKVTLSADQKNAQLVLLTSAIVAGTAIMTEFSLYHLLLDRIKEELAKYLVLSMLVSTFFLAGTIGYVVYPYMKSKPPQEEKPALVPKKPKKQKKIESQLPFEDSNDVQETEAQTEEPDNQTTSGRRPSSNRTTIEPESPPQTGEANEPGDTAAPQENYAPSCEFILLSNPPLLAGTPIRFEASFSDPDGEIVKVVWDFGNGDTQELGPDFNIVQQVYATSGNYKVTLTVFDDAGNSNTFSDTITITDVNQSPIALFSDDSPKKVGEPVTFSNQSYDPDGFIVEIHWDFDDVSTSTAKNPTHVYTASGTYMVTLKVIDDQGGYAQISKVINILADTNQAPVAFFTAPAKHKPNEDVKFQNHSYDPDPFDLIVNTHWDFGDGDSSILEEPTHKYVNSGTYHVVLTITDSHGATSSYTKTIEIH